MITQACEAPTASVASGPHTTARPFAVQPSREETNSSEAGSRSVTRTRRAADGPRLVTVTT